jgi:hypothetical protein
MNRALNSLQKIKFNPLVNRIIFEQGKKKYLVKLNRFNLNVNPVIIRKYTTSSSNNQPNNDDNNIWFGIGVMVGFVTGTSINSLYKK